MSAESMTMVTGGQLLLPGGVLKPGSLSIEGDRIREVGEAAPAGVAVRKIDATGCTVMPGLIDLHSHLTLVPEVHAQGRVARARVALLAARQARRALRAGITRCRDIGGYRHVDIALRDAITQGLVPGPTMSCAGQFIAMTGGHGYPYVRQADGVPEVRKAAREQLRAGANFIKYMGSGGIGRAGEVETSVQFSSEEARAIVEEAKAAGTVAAAHVHPPEAIRRALEAGVRSVEHGSYLTDELSARMVELDVFLVPTFAIIRRMTTDPALADLKDRAARMYEVKVRTFSRAVEAGVSWGIGTDAGALTPIESIVEELEILEGLGFSRQELLEKVTLGNAALWGWSEVGELRRGWAADVLVVRGNPLASLSALRQVEVTICRGEVHDWRDIGGAVSSTSTN